MATITISLSGSAIITGSRNYTLSDVMVQRLIDGMKHYHGADLTNGQALVAWADGLIAETKASVLRAEQNKADVEFEEYRASMFTPPPPLEIE